MKGAISGTASKAQKQRAELKKKTEAELAEAQKQLDELIANEKSLTQLVKNSPIYFLNFQKTFKIV